MAASQLSWMSLGFFLGLFGRSPFCHLTMSIQYWALRYVMPSRFSAGIQSPCSRLSWRSIIACPNLFPSSGMPAVFSALSSSRKD